ncbi:MAG: hypothetical protein ACR2HP_03590 [Ilumatobacteraceae bacterium]
MGHEPCWVDAGFDEVVVVVNVRDGEFPGEGDVVHTETALIPPEHALTLDRLQDLAPKFVYRQLRMTDGYVTTVEGRHWSMGGDGESVLITVELIKGLTTVAWSGLAALFVKFVLDKAKPQDDDE